MFIVGVSRFRSVNGYVVRSDEGKEDSDYDHRPDRSPECEPEGGCLELGASSAQELSYNTIVLHLLRMDSRLDREIELPHHRGYCNLAGT